MSIPLRANQPVSLIINLCVGRLPYLLTDVCCGPIAFAWRNCYRSRYELYALPIQPLRATVQLYAK